MSISCSLVVTCWERADHLAPLYVMFSWFFVTFPYHTMSWVTCGTWLYRFLAFAFFFSLLTDNMQLHLWDWNPQPFYLDSSTLPLGTVLAYFVVITMKVSDYCKRSRSNISYKCWRESLSHFLDTSKWKFQSTNMTVGSKVEVLRIRPTARNMNFCILW